VLIELLIFVKNLAGYSGGNERLEMVERKIVCHCTYSFSMASDISGQNSSTILSSFFRAKILSSGKGSSRREMIPAAKFHQISNFAFVGYHDLHKAEPFW
jgi:hypothetical protein